MNDAKQKQEDPLNLQSLPLVSPPGDGWPAVAAALQRDARERSLRRVAIGALAAAATVSLAVGLYLQGSPSRPAVQPATQLAGNPSDPTSGPDEFKPRQGESVEALIALSQQLEARLRLVRTQGGSLPASAVVYQVELEDLVIQVDEELSRQPDSLALWNQRVNLLMDLEQLYENRLRREYSRMASL